MAKHIKSPTVVKAAGVGEKIIKEFIGRVNSGHENVSIARMSSPQGWYEPPQTPEFQETTFVLKGTVHIKHAGETHVVQANEVFIAETGETIQYSTPAAGGAEYIAVCIPGFSPETVNRGDEEGIMKKE